MCWHILAYPIFAATLRQKYEASDLRVEPADENLELPVAIWPYILVGNTLGHQFFAPRSSHSRPVQAARNGASMARLLCAEEDAETSCEGSFMNCTTSYR